VIALAQRPPRIAAAAAALGLAIAGCGESRKQSSSTSTTPSPAQSTAPKPAEPGVAVTEREFSLSPATLDVPKGGTITISIRNAGGIEHALEVEGPHGEAKSDSIAPGGSGTLRVVLDKPGRYEWYCPIADHRDRGMRGTIVVAGGGAKPKQDDKGGKRKHKKRRSGGGSGSGDHMGGGSDGSSGGVAPPSGNSPSDGSYYKG
jgi:uncharacterized cupredoxin-like copper-binding protein